LIYYVEGLLAFLAVSACLYIFFYNVIIKYQYTMNRLLAVCALNTASLYTLFIILNLNIPGLPGVLLARIFLALVHLLAILLFNLMQIYPDIGKRRHIIVYLLAGIPGYAMIAITLGTDLVIQNIPFVGYANRHRGSLYLGYLICAATYFAASVIIVFIKSRFFANRFLRREVSYYLMGIGSAVAWGILLIIVIPTLFKIEETRNIGTLTAGMFILLFVNATVVDIRRIDLKKFYLDMFSWLIIGFLLFAPVAVILFFSFHKYPSEEINLIMITIVIFLYMFLFYKYLKPGIENFFSREYTRMVNDFNRYFRSVKKVEMESDQKTFWKKFFHDSITTLINTYGMLGGYLFILDYQDNSFKPAHIVGEDINIDKIEENDPLITCLLMEAGILTSSILYTDQRYIAYKDEALSKLNENHLELAVPLFGIEKKLVGILFLGRFPGRRLYSKAFISVLELFRIQFQHQLSNGLILDEVKMNQVMAHDRLVVDTIKKKITPVELHQVKGIRISSFNINNSSQGGDYLDSMVIGKEKIALITADVSYSGVDSGILALEIYTAFHTPVRNIDTPDKILNNMNWVISTSKFSKKYAPAFCMTYSKGIIEYSSAAYNPLVMYNPADNTFIEHTSKGIPIGVDRDFIYEIKEIPVQPGMIGFIYSDGLVSAMNSTGESYGLENVKKIISKEHENNPVYLVREIYVSLNSFIGEHKQLSDISIILFKV